MAWCIGCAVSSDRAADPLITHIPAHASSSPRRLSSFRFAVAQSRQRSLQKVEKKKSSGVAVLPALVAEAGLAPPVPVEETTGTIPAMSSR